jgi:hypothetical protein
MSKSKKRKESVPTMETWRGAPCLDFNMVLFYAHAPLEEAATAFTKAFGCKSWHKDVLDKAVPISEHAYVTYQFKGHLWTIFDNITLAREKQLPRAQAAKKLSTILKGKAMYFAISDTGGHYEYAIFDCGKLVQRYCDSDAGFEFESSDSDVEAPDPGDLMEHFNDFLTEQDILVPPFGTIGNWVDLPFFKKLPAKVTIGEWEEFNAQNIARVDLIIGV